MLPRHVLLLYVVFFLLLSTSLTLAAPKIEFETTEYDFGKINQGEKAKFSFKFKNAGDDTLLINNVKASCGCTATMLSKKVLAPGEKGQIETSFNTKGYLGHTQKSITVKSNDTQNPKVTLYIKGNVHVEVRVTPKTIYINWNGKDPVMKRNIEIANLSEKLIKIDTLETTSQAITVKVKPSALPIQIEPKGKYSIELEIALSGLEKGWKKMGEVKIATNSKMNPNFKIAVYVSVPKAK